MAMKEYHKIQGIFAFDATTKKPTQEIVEYFEPMINWKWIFTEKIDWTNIRIYRDWHTITFGGRTDRAEIPPRLLKRLQELFVEELFEQNFGETPVTLYGEWYGGKIQHWIRDYKEQEDFVLFDVFIGEVWLERKNIEWIAKNLWIDVVPIILEWNLLEWIEYVKENYVWKDKNDKQIEWLIGIPVWWYRDRKWSRIIVKIKQEHFKV